MIQPYNDRFHFETRIASTSQQEIARVPIGPGGDALGAVELMIGGVGAGGRVILDEVRVRFLKAGSSLLLNTPTRPEPPDRRGPIAAASMDIVAVSTDLVVRVTLPNAEPVDVFVLCDIRGFYRAA